VPEIVIPSDNEIFGKFDHLYSFQRIDPDKSRPLLAHYTSIKVMENILSTSEVWFGNPLFMNDLQEMRFGLGEGTRYFADINNLMKAAGTRERTQILQQAYLHYFSHFDMHQAFDTYIFCLTEHEPSNNDGMLSMWRGYGQHGNGAALVFDASKVTMVPTSPLVVTKVSYVSDAMRVEQLRALLAAWSDVTQKLQLPDDRLYLASYVAFSLVKGHALSTKHVGFSEEKEWRIIYYPERDQAGALKPFLHYHVGDRGVEPKLKYKIGHIAGVSAPDLALERLLNRIILGPSVSSPLSKRGVERMLDNIDRPQFKPLLRSSGIPLRPVSGSSF
jgi:hypothetical protein